MNLFQNLIFPCKTVNCDSVVSEEDTEAMQLQTLKWRESVKGHLMETSWFFIKNVQSEIVVLWAHTNSEKLNRELWNQMLELSTVTGCSVVCWDYPGYGLSTGHPSEHTVYQCTVAMFREVTWQLNLAKDANIVLIGQSLGTAAVTFLAERCPDILAIVLISPFKSITQIATGLSIPGLDGFRNDKRLPKLKVPVLIIHGEDDDLVPLAQAQALYAACPTSVDPLWLPLRDHDDVLMDESVFPRINAFIQDCSQKSIASEEREVGQVRTLPPILPTTIDRAMTPGLEARLSVDFGIPRSVSAPPTDHLPRKSSLDVANSDRTSFERPEKKRGSIFKSLFNN
jgi:predicted alpha/beta-hydrolase family hydrolase